MAFNQVNNIAIGTANITTTERKGHNQLNEYASQASCNFFADSSCKVT